MEQRKGILGKLAKIRMRRSVNNPQAHQEELFIDVNDGADSNDSDKVSKTKLLLAVGAAGLLIPGTARADWMDSLANKLLSGIKSAIQPVFDTFTKALSGDFGEIFDKTSEKVSIAIGGMTDMIGSVITDTENNKIKQDTKPAPDECNSDLLGKESTAAQNRTVVHATSESVSLSNRVMKASAGAGRATLQELKDKYGEIPQESLTPTIALNKASISDATELAKVQKSKDIIAGNTAYVGSQQLIQTTINQYGERAGLDAQANVMAKNLRLQVCLDPHVQAVAARDGTAGDSKMYIMEQEVERTYGSDENGWRKEINEAASPVPLLKDLCKQVSFQNKLLLEQLLLSERHGMVASVSILEKMDQNRTDNLRHEAV